MSKKFGGKTAVVTGGSTGIGLATAKRFVQERGHAKDESIQRFLAAGYKKEQVMELLVGIALKTISNYLDHISPTLLDQAFAGESK